jgi:hypothetical protein
MAKHRYVVTAEFKAWIPGERDDPEKQFLSIKATERFDVFADSETPGDFVTFDIDANEYEVDRETFTNSTNRWKPDL